ncbi:MAG TPA: hypothetical protein VJ725_27095 [Thermoanaerobaculia bacterium]|nr:hypothetical protein [Thermoanaerobaculia bacterium]
MSQAPPNSVHPKTRAEWRKWLEKHHTISNAWKPETRAKRVEETAQKAAENVRANQWRG